MQSADLAANFAIKLFKSSKSLEFFEPVQKQTNTRSEKLLVKEKVTNTLRCFNAPHNYLARLVNLNKHRIAHNNTKWFFMIGSVKLVHQFIAQHLLLKDNGSSAHCFVLQEILSLHRSFVSCSSPYALLNKTLIIIIILRDISES